MRRHAGTPVGSLVSVAILLASSCTRTWALPPDPVDAAAPVDMNTTEAGGATGQGGAPGTGGRGSGGSSGTGGSIGGGCSPIQDTIPVLILTTDLMFIVPRTMSMGSKFGDTTRLGAVQSALRYFVQTYQSAINFGYAEFPAQSVCPNNACCVSPNAVATQARSYQAIDLALRTCDLGPPCLAQSDARPIAQTLMNVANHWGSKRPNDGTIVLIADGPPGCPFEDPGQSCQPALDAVLNLNRNLENYVETYVLALGQDAQNDQCLQKMAAQGGTQEGYLIRVPEGGPADPLATLNTALERIIAAAAETSCTIQLTSQPSRSDQVQVVIGGAEVPYDSAGKNGWKFQNGSRIRIQLRGASCTALRNARPSDVSARFGCPPCGEMFPCP